MKAPIIQALTLSLTAVTLYAAEDHLVFEPQGSANGKHVVLLSGDEEYRSEESMPMMAQILANNGFKATVLFSLNEDGTVNPEAGTSLSNSAALDDADAIVMCIRFRHWGDEAMQRFENALNRGVPMVALRTSTHAFNFKDKSNKWAKYSFDAKADTGWEGGFGRQVLGETWVSHHGKHKKEGTRSKIETANAKHPVLNGVGPIFGTTDVYGAAPLAPSTILLRGEVTQTLDPESPAVEGAKNAPMIPIAWVREFDNSGEKNNRILTTTMGAATDLSEENLRRLVVNGVYWGLEMEVPAKADVSIKGEYAPSPYSFKKYKKGLKPADFIVK
ncbi:ThuA domain-containing protein [Rubritalea spongiae]|uniref:ThuA domain-containing protein n=1 Tax=Rubritalea spongiae TaxID=430797 RepID=A0ABW5DZR8_9BACT